jgi:hypothetical protein
MYCRIERIAIVGFVADQVLQLRFNRVALHDEPRGLMGVEIMDLEPTRITVR